MGSLPNSVSPAASATAAAPARPAEAIPYRLGAIARGGGGPWTPWLWLAGDYAAVGDTAAAVAALDSAHVRAPSSEALALIDRRLGALDRPRPGESGGGPEGE